MATPLIMPKFEMAQERGTVVAWLHKEGDRVEKGEPLLEVETDKVIMEVESPAGGILCQILAKVGEEVPVAQIIAYIVQSDESKPGGYVESLINLEAASLTVVPSPKRRETPLAKRVAQKAGIDVRRVTASDRHGWVTRQDVEIYLAQRLQDTASPRPRATPAARRIARLHEVDLEAVTGSGPRGRIQAADVLAGHQPHVADSEPDISVDKDASQPDFAVGPELLEVIPLQGMRRTIAERMQQSYQTAPHIMLSVEVEMSAVQALLDQLNVKNQAQQTPRVSITAILIKVCAWALQRHPRLNAALLETGIHIYAKPNIGVAIALEDGLIVPVIHAAHRLDLSEIASRLQDLTERAHAGRLVLTDVSGGTFTLSNLGMFGIDHFTAIINPPQSAILAVGRIVKRAVVCTKEQGDEVVIRPVMRISLSVDHRIVDGVVAARFLQDLVAVLENPDLLMA